MSDKSLSDQSECLYGFQRAFFTRFFMDVLYEKAKVLYHDESEESIWEYKVPELIDRLYQSMDQNDPTLCNELFEIEKCIISKLKKVQVTGEVIEQKNDPTKKAMNNLIQQVMLQKEAYDNKCKATKTVAPAETSSASSNVHTRNPTKRLPKIPSQKRKRQTEKPTQTTSEKKTKIEMPSTLASTVDKDDSGSSFGCFQPQPLPNYDVPVEIFKIESKEDFSYMSTIYSMIDDSKSDRFRYTQAYKALLYLEEAAGKVSTKKYDRTNIQLSYSNLDSKSNSQRIFAIENDENMTQIQQAIDEKLVDQFDLKTSLGYYPKVVVSGRVKRFDDNFIYVDILEKDFFCLKTHCVDIFFDIYFKINNLPYKVQHKALEYVERYNLHPLLIANRKYDYHDASHDEFDQTTDYKFSGNLAESSNEEQQMVVKSIAKMDKTLPYLLSGPAGTGKTRTLVAVIEETLRSSNDYILVCANSNAASDEIAERLLKVLKPGELFRLYARSYNASLVSKAIKKCSNFIKGQFTFPSLSFLYKFRVLVCTLLTAGHLMRGRNDPNFKHDHYAMLITDECASTNETTTLVPIAGICSTKNKITAKIILAGDPKQLNAVCKSDNAGKLGYKTSLMERLFNRPLYKKHPMTGKLNPRYITQLVQNYRSHNAILHVANRLFYDGELISKAPEEITDWFVGSDILVNKEIPIIFKSINGSMNQTDNDCSLFNLKEAYAVIDQIKEIRAAKVNNRQIENTDIGVVTPYRRQGQIISRLCSNLKYIGITIGTAEVFQGQERPVMILSTVRTGGILGFVNSEQRINVVLTRAKSLLIIIGDPHTLYKDVNWQYLLRFCYLNDSFVQAQDNIFTFPEPIKEEGQEVEM